MIKTKYRILENVNGIFTVQLMTFSPVADWQSICTTSSFDKAMKIVNRMKKDFDNNHIKIHYID